MKKVITILVVIILLATTLAITVPASAENDKEVLYEAALVSLRPGESGMEGVIFGKATVYDNFEVEFEIQDKDAPNAIYTASISYGFPDNRMVVDLGTITANGDGEGEGCFDLTGLSSPPCPPPPMPCPSLEAPTFLPHPGFILFRPNPGPGPPYIFYNTSFIMPTETVKRDLVEVGTDPWNVVGSTILKVIEGEALIVEVRMDTEPNLVDYDVGVLVFYSLPPADPTPPDVFGYFEDVLDTDALGHGIARVELGIAPTGDRIWVYVGVREVPSPPPPFIPPDYFNMPPLIEVPF